MSTLLLHISDIGARERFMVRLQYWAISVFPFWLQSSSAWPLFISLKKSFSVVSSPRLVAIMSRPTRRMGGTDPSPVTSKYFTSSKSPPRNFDHSTRRQSPRLFNAQSSSDNNDTEENRNPLPTLSAEWNDAPLSAANDSHSPIDTPRKKRGSAKTTPGRKHKKAKNQNTPRTQSFAPLTTDLLVGNNEDGDRRVVPHTLILGTHPSITSLEQSQYYGHPMNTFWWIAGDCLGFRRDTGISKSSGKPFVFAQHLRHTNILPYEEQLQMLLKHGFLLWDIVASCSRPGSLDQDIREEVPNDIPKLCSQYPSIKRIVLANGGSAKGFFTKHFGDWMQECTNDQSIIFQAGKDSVSQTNFEKYCQKLQSKKKPSSMNGGPSILVSSSTTRSITLISAISVSPAAARYKYEEKLDFWETNVYKPGLQDYKDQQPNE